MRSPSLSTSRARVVHNEGVRLARPKSALLDANGSKRKETLVNRIRRHTGRQLTTFFLLGVALLRFWPAAGDAARQLAHPYRWVDQVGPDRAIAEFAIGLLWLTSAWLATALLAAIWIERTGRGTRLIRRVARSTPRSLRRLVFTSVGISLIASPAAASAASPGRVTTPSTVSTTPSTIAAPLWPTTAQPSTSPVVSSAPAPEVVPAPQWPTETTHPTPTAIQPRTIAGPTLPTNAPPTNAPPTNAPPTNAPPTNAPPTNAPPTNAPPTIPMPTTPTLTTPAPPTSTTAPEPSTPPPVTPTPTNPILNVPKSPPIENYPIHEGETVLVQPGDSLWTITARQLGPTANDADIAVEWPYWYRTNHRVIGDDPGVLHPGQRLVVPSQKG